MFRGKGEGGAGSPDAWVLSQLAGVHVEPFQATGAALLALGAPAPGPMLSGGRSGESPP